MIPDNCILFIISLVGLGTFKTLHLRRDEFNPKSALAKITYFFCTNPLSCARK